MRVSASSNGLSVKAIAGTRVVLIALNMSADASKGLLGFSFKRGVAGAPKTFLTGKKAFPSHLKPNDPHAKYSTETDPIQSFLWSDEAARPDTAYEFTIAALFGAPDALVARASVDVKIKTEVEDDGKSAVYFNRGAIASQAFAEHFSNKALTTAQESDIGDEEMQFLSRGLAEGFLDYVKKTQSGEGLRVVAYEFDYPLVLNALKGAHDRGVGVEIVYDEGQGDKTERALVASGLRGVAPGILFQRKKAGGIPHNKFIVRLDAAKRPVAVWTGSTNFTASGFLGQTNVGHVVHDGDVAVHYLKFFNALKSQPAQPAAKADAVALTPDPANLPAGPITTVFSPRGKDPMMNWYGQRIGDARNAAMITCPFNVDNRVAAPMSMPGAANCYLLLEKPPPANVKAAKKNNPGGLNISFGAVLGQIRMQGKNEKGKLVTKVVPIPNFELDKWFLKEELARKTEEGFVFFIHSKFLLVDPLSDDPLVCTGSANFSSASQENNDENMLLIRGDTRVADIYLTEFDRIFRHFFFRGVANLAAVSGADPAARKAIELDTTDGWLADYFKAGHPKSRRREMFFAPASPDWTEAAGTDANVFTTPQPPPIIPGFVAAPKKKAATKKSTAKRSLAKGPPAKKVAAKKSATKASAAKNAAKRAAKKTVGKKPPARKKPAPHQSTSRKPSAKKRK